MEAAFWHERWREGRIGFHEAEGNALVAKHLSALRLAPGARVLVPLAGKSRDVGRLMSQGFRVAATELDRGAVEALFSDLGLTPDEVAPGHLTAPGLDVFVGDHMALTPDRLGPCDAVVDRAALIALPCAMRAAYAAHFATLAPALPHLLVTLDYDQAAMDGPPFAVSGAEVARLFPRHAATLLERRAAGGPVARVGATEAAWLLTPTERPQT
jgi:thiopurine S-methyltransferase